MSYPIGKFPQDWEYEREVANLPPSREPVSRHSSDQEKARRRSVSFSSDLAKLDSHGSSSKESTGHWHLPESDSSEDDDPRAKKRSQDRRYDRPVRAKSSSQSERRESPLEDIEKIVDVMKSTQVASKDTLHNTDDIAKAKIARIDRLLQELQDMKQTLLSRQ